MAGSQGSLGSLLGSLESRMDDLSQEEYEAFVKEARGQGKGGEASEEHLENRDIVPHPELPTGSTGLSQDLGQVGIGIAEGALANQHPPPQQRARTHNPLRANLSRLIAAFARCNRCCQCRQRQYGPCGVVVQ